MKKRFDDSVVVVTGASSGIGKASAIAFSREGATVALVSRSREKLNAVANEIKSASGTAFVQPADVSSRSDVESALSDIVAKFGRIDVLFNNAGTSHVGRIDQDGFVDDVREMFETDYMGTVYATRAVLSVMRKQGFGHIMNMSSVVGRKAFPAFGGYSSIMHAVDGFSDALRQELKGSGINVSVIHPALTQTPLLANANPEDMPPPFRRLTPMPVEKVAVAVLDGISRNQPRVVVPFQPKLLLLANAISPTLGDIVVKLLQNTLFSTLLRTYRGGVYQH